jgi:hypothetical protein
MLKKSLSFLPVRQAGGKGFRDRLKKMNPE